jgi:hypothetical protein
MKTFWLATSVVMAIFWGYHQNVPASTGWAMAALCELEGILRQ